MLLRTKLHGKTTIHEWFTNKRMDESLFDIRGFIRGRFTTEPESKKI